MSDTDLAFRATLDGSGFASGAQRINGQLQQMGFHTQTATAGLGGIGTMLGTMANPATAAALAVTALGGALVGSAQSAAAWQTSMTGVAKTTGLGGADLAELSDQLLTMSTNMPVAASGLAEIAQAGGSLGIAKEELAGFTEVAAQMGVGFEMSAEQAATAGAKILNAFGQEMDTENLRSLGSVVNAMGDSFAATEPQVLDFLNKASFLNTTMGQSIPQVAALGTTLVSAGMGAEVAATGIKSALNTLTSETSRTGGMTNWAKLMGTDVDTLKEKIASDLNGTLIETANTIAAIEDPTERFQKAVQLAGTEGAPALLKLAGTAEDYAKALGMSNEEWENATSLQKTYDAQMSTVTSQWTIFTNTLSMASTELGTVMLPTISSALGTLTELTKAAVDTAEAIGDIAGAWGNMVKSSVSDSAALEKAYEETNKGHWEMIAGDAVWIGEDFGKAISDGIKESDDLKTAAAEALDTPEAKAATEKAACESAEEFSKEWVQGFKKAQGSREIAKILAREATRGLESGDLTKNKGNVAGWASTTLKNGLNIDIAYQGRGNEIISRLFIDGQQIGGYVVGSREEGIRELLKTWQYDQGNVYELMDEPGNAAVWRSSQHVVNIADLIFAPETAIKSKIKELTDAAKSAFEDGIMTMGKDSEQLNLLGLAQDLDMLRAQFPNEFEKIGGEAIKELEDALKRNDIVKAMAILGEIAGEEFTKNLVGGAKIEMPSLLEMVEDPKLIMETFESIPKFQENYLIPRLTENMDEVKELMTSGVKEQEIIDAYIKPLEAVYDYMPEKLQDIYKQVTNGQMSLESFVDQYYDGFTEKADEKASEAAEAFKSTNAMFYNEILDDSEHWSSYINSEGGFIGPTAKWYEMKIDEQAELNNIAALKQIYEGMGGESPAMVGSIATKLDTTEAYNDLEAIKADIVSANPTTMLELDTSVADSRFQNFFKLVEESRPTMYFDAIPVVNMNSLVSAIAAALRAEGV